MNDNLTSSGASAPVDDAVVAVVGDSMLEKRAKKIKVIFPRSLFLVRKVKNKIKKFMNGLHPQNDS
jgi:hypothetical protein